jgi:hypothetical protein
MDESDEFKIASSLDPGVLTPVLSFSSFWAVVGTWFDSGRPLVGWDDILSARLAVCDLRNELAQKDDLLNEFNWIVTQALAQNYQPLLDQK